MNAVRHLAGAAGGFDGAAVDGKVAIETDAAAPEFRRAARDDERAAALDGQAASGFNAEAAEYELVLVMVLVVPSARTIFAPAGRATAIEAALVKFTPLRVRVFVVLSHSALVVSGVPSLSPVVSSASALLPSS